MLHGNPATIGSANDVGAGNVRGRKDFLEPVGGVRGADDRDRLDRPAGIAEGVDCDHVELVT